MGSACCAADHSKGAAGPMVVDTMPPAESSAPLEPESTVDTMPPAESSAPLEPESTADPAVTSPVVIIVGARGLRNSDWLPGTGKPDCCVQVKSKDKLLHTTAVINNTCEPVWMEKQPLAELEGEAPLEFSVYDKDLVGSDFLGRVTLEAQDYAGQGFNGELQLQDAKAPQAAYLKVKVQVPGKDLPPGPPAEYTVTVEKASEKDSYAMRLDKQDPKRLNVILISDGPFKEYNANAKPEEQIRENDFLVCVNSATDAAAMHSEFRSALRVECKFKRAVPVSIVLDRGDSSEPLGLEMPDKLGAMVSVVVVSVQDGPVARHNEAVEDHEKINPGDRILSVGGTAGSAEDVKRALEGAKGRVQLTLLKPAVCRSEEGDSCTWSHWLFG